MFNFDSPDHARRTAVDDPTKLTAQFATRWPPRSRKELAELYNALRRGLVTPEAQLATYLIRRLQRAALAVRHRSARHRTTNTWSMTAPNGQTIRFPIGDSASVEFKKMVDRYDREYESTLIKFVTARLGLGDVFVDVGANVGYISAFAATTGASVFAMEIQRDLMPLIEQMATINGFDLVRALHIGASAHCGLSMMARLEANPGTQLEGQTRRFAGHEPGSIVDDFVPVMALDNLFSDDKLLPKLVKVDVEGHEIGVLDGARRIIEIGRTSFVVEFHPHLIALYGRRPQELLARFDPSRWSMSQLTDTGLQPITGIDDIQPDSRDPNPKLVFEPRAD